MHIQKFAHARVLTSDDLTFSHTLFSCSAMVDGIASKVQHRHGGVAGNNFNIDQKQSTDALTVVPVLHWIVRPAYGGGAAMHTRTPR